MKILVFKYLLVVSCFAGKVYGQPGIPPCEAFDTIGKDTILVINSHSNSLYAGIDNYIKINPEKIPYKNLIVECERGMAMEDEGLYFVIPSKPGTTSINIYEYDKGDTNLVLKKAMIVKAVPQPYVALDHMKLSDYKYFPRDEFKKESKFEVHLSEDFVDDSDWYLIKEFTIGYPVGQQYVTISTDGNELSPEMFATIQKLMAGKELSFTFTLVGSGGMFKRIPPIRMKIY